MSSNHTELWNKCCEFIRDNIGIDQYNTWFAAVSSLSYADRVLWLNVDATQFFVEQLEYHYRDIIRKAIKKVYGDGIELKYRFKIVSGDPDSEVRQKSTEMSPVILAQASAAPADPFMQPTPKQFDPQLNPRYTFENYCESSSNQIARTIGEAIGDNPTLKTFNPLFVFGPSGVGKTHLIQAIGIRIKERNPQARVLYVTARLFQSQYTAALRNINSFFHFYQSIDTLIIDDIQDLQNLPGTQNTFFHIFNHLYLHNKQIIMSSDCAPSEMEGFEMRMLTRFKAGTQVELELPDLSLRRDVLRLKAEQDGIDLPQDVAEYIVTNVTGSVRELEGIMVSLLAHATVLNREISLDLAKRVISNAVKVPTRKINFEMVAQAVASHFKINADLLFTKTRKREISDPRQIVMYLAKKLVHMPLTTIGTKLDRSHATVIYAVQNIESRLGHEKKLSADIDAIEAAVMSGC